jgi:hypothetical protein
MPKKSVASMRRKISRAIKALELKPYEDFVWYAGKVWLYEGTPDRTGRHLLSHPFDSSIAVGALPHEFQKVTYKTKLATLKAIAHMFDIHTHPRHRGRVHNPRGVDIRIQFDDDDPELVRGIIIFPVSMAAKTWLNWMDELLGIQQIAIMKESGKSRGAYYAPLDKAKWLITEFRKGWNVVVEDE